jgi:hypothetical protein
VGEKRSVYRLLEGNPDERRLLGRPRYRRVDNIKMDVVEIGWVVWNRLVWLWIGTSG